MAFSSLYSCMMIDATQSPPGSVFAGTEFQYEWDLFVTSRAQPMAGTDRTLTAAHTNVPRASGLGLPKDWTADIERWRALTSVRFADPVLDWAATTSASFIYDDNKVDQRPLLDLLLAPQLISCQRMTEQRYYRVTISSQELRPLANLIKWIDEHTPEKRMLLWVFLDGLITPCIK